MPEGNVDSLTHPSGQVDVDPTARNIELIVTVETFLKTKTDSKETKRKISETAPIRHPTVTYTPAAVWPHAVCRRQ